jgi:hypothetical protein
MTDEGVTGHAFLGTSTGIAAATGRLNKIFRPQNRGAVIQTLPATSSSEDDPRSLRFSNGF